MKFALKSHLKLLHRVRTASGRRCRRRRRNLLWPPSVDELLYERGLVVELRGGNVAKPIRCDARCKPHRGHLCQNRPSSVQNRPKSDRFHGENYGFQTSLCLPVVDLADEALVSQHNINVASD